jgi:phytoene dehydrogenase-like protein
MVAQSSKKTCKVIIVGGGLGGLATAALLAKAGFSVTLYEKRQTIGGRAVCKKIGDYWLDSGFHSLRKADKGPAAVVLEKIGKPIEFATKYSEGVVPKTYDKGKLADSPLSVGQLLLRYPLLSFMQKMRMMTLIWKIKKTPIEKLDQMTIAELLTTSKINDKNIISHLKQMISIAYYCEPDLEKISAGELARYLADWPYDVGFPKGGWKQLIDKLQEAIVENGGVIRTGKDVRSIWITEEETGGSVVGGSPGAVNMAKAAGVVFQDGSKEEADFVVLNTPLKEIPDLLEKKYLSQELSQLLDNNDDIQTSAAVVMDIAVNQQIIRGKPDSIITLDPCTILRVNSKYDSNIAPHGYHLLSAWMPIDSIRSKNRDYVDNKFKELEQIIHQVFFENFKNDSVRPIRKMVFRTAIGFYPSPSMTRSKRPGIIFPSVTNLYLVGDSTNAEGIGGSSDISFNSAIECHNAITSKEIELTAQCIAPKAFI